MATNQTALCRRILTLISKEPMTRPRLLDRCVTDMLHDPEALADNSTGGKKNRLRTRIGQAISYLLSHDAIAMDEKGRFHVIEDSPVVIREAQCEAEILRLLAVCPRKKNEVRDALVEKFGTDKTATQTDDARLSSCMGQVLTRLCAHGVLNLRDGVYSLSAGTVARVGDAMALSQLRADFLSALHDRGGEFFEHYFMTLLGKYFARNGKTVTENVVLGGSDDGGIDGRVRTVDFFGFRECTLVQAKNRNGDVCETDVRAFYGAVCAAGGSRGLFVTTADFLPSAQAFLDSVDNCVGVNGYRVFDMAVAVGYGIRRSHGQLSMDCGVIPRV